jgi:hypothetical protein
MFVHKNKVLKNYNYFGVQSFSFARPAKAKALDSNICAGRAKLKL